MRSESFCGRNNLMRRRNGSVIYIIKCGNIRKEGARMAIIIGTLGIVVVAVIVVVAAVTGVVAGVKDTLKDEGNEV